ncbi:hypothetical protein FY034_18790 (plasmid) [Trichlorobacter lovleyi]|uniref:hypothetical protein n=1 Tax=Trichlorobacter lovleyi TaxID=313985 RepID=UPI00223EB144|nr:hypothetical protein [Trichlorobacter lovleyi]QOX81025.1 hypothetical protein FY034_18790 [Trichlorobacter lovleyi]
MNQVVRSIGVGFALSAFYMVYGLSPKGQGGAAGVWGVNSIGALIKPLVLNTNSPGMAIAIWITLCLGLGLFAGGLLWPRVENVCKQLQGIFLQDKH